MPDRAATLAAFRDKYPVYRDMSDDEIGTRLAAQYPKEYGFLAAQRVGDVPVAPKGVKPDPFPSPMQYLGRNLRERSGDIAATAAASLVPGGAGARPFLARLLASEIGHDVGQAAAGNKITPGYGTASQLVGEGVGKVIGPQLSPIALRKYASETATKLADQLKKLVPAWAHLPSTEKGLYEMVHGTGQRALSRSYETALNAVKGQIPTGHSIVLEPADARALGLTGSSAPATPWQAYQAKKLGLPAPQTGVAVGLGEAIDALPGVRTSDPSLYRRLLRDVDRGLERVAPGLGAEFMQQRAAYRSGAGFMDFAERGKFLYGERFDPVKAQRAIDAGGKKQLLSRGMDDVRATVRGPNAEPIEAVKRPWWANRLEGAAGGEALAYMLGIPRGVGGLAGGVAGGMLPNTTYRNVPMTPAMEWAARLSRPLVAEGAREGGRQLGVPERYP